MCRYAVKSYKETYACFKCRKVFKKINFSDYLIQNNLGKLYSSLFNCKNADKRGKLESECGTSAQKIEQDYQKKISVCPECAGLMADFGKDMRAPKKNDVKEWDILEGMYHMGISFRSCGCQCIGFVPKSKSDYKSYLNNHLGFFTKYRDDTQNDTTLNAYQRQGKAQYWQGRIDAVTKLLAQTV